MDTHYIVTFVGDDRPGLVEALARVIEAQGGNWLESKLAQLGGKFAGLILVSIHPNQADTLHQALEDELGAHLELRISAGAQALPTDADQPLSLSLMGPDRPGIVREVSGALAQRGINVLRLLSDVVSAPMSAEPMFQAHIEATIPADADLSTLQEQLDDIANQMTLEIDLD